ncbi:MAG: head maturation protease, ClpP-related, partial [bacterium]
MRKISSNAPVPYFSIARDNEEKRADIYIFGDIAQRKGGLAKFLQPSSDQSSYDLANQVNEIPADWEITVHINSNGGELKEGLGIYNTLKARNVTTICEGFAASAGSVIFCAGAKRIMQPASLLFIHQAHMSKGGNADDFEKAAEDLRIVTEAAVAAYKECGLAIDDDTLHAMLKAETWITPEEAVACGFAT